MKCQDVVDELKQLGTDQTRRILLNHGAPDEGLLGVKVGDLKAILKKTKKDHALALELFETGLQDARYLAALMADAKKVSRETLDHWATANTWFMCAEYGIGALAAESAHGWPAGLDWIDSDLPQVQVCGWSALAGWVALKKDEDLDQAALKGLLARVERDIHQAHDRVRYAMNHFVISLGSYVADLTALAIEKAKAIGTVEVDMANTNCKVPFAPDYIAKIQSMDRIGKKRKKVRC